mmetsp:Transcript_66109/g.187544  ORF Transcript_66109/g.187544 Transcript_66109/m.187544 type:complete len:243 (+) Transcript_66109:1-729(+)
MKPASEHLVQQHDASALRGRRRACQPPRLAGRPRSGTRALSGDRPGDLRGLHIHHLRGHCDVLVLVAEGLGELLDLGLVVVGEVLELLVVDPEGDPGSGQLCRLFPSVRSGLSCLASVLCRYLLLLRKPLGFGGSLLLLFNLLLFPELLLPLLRFLLGLCLLFLRFQLLLQGPLGRLSPLRDGVACAWWAQAEAGPERGVRLVDDLVPVVAGELDDPHVRSPLDPVDHLVVALAPLRLRQGA